MAGDWIQLDDDLPQKAEFVRIVTVTGLTPDVVLGRLALFWIWVDRHAGAQNVRGVSAVSLAHIAGGDEKFWRDAAGEWLRFTSDGIEIPGWKKRFDKSAKRRALDARRKRAVRPPPVRTPAEEKRTPCGTTEEQKTADDRREECVNGQKTVDRDRIGRSAAASDHALIFLDEDTLERASRFVGNLFKRCGYSGTDGAILWKAGVLVACPPPGAPALAEGWVVSAAEGTRLNAKASPLGHFRTVLREQAAAKGVDSDAALKALRLPKGFEAGPPAQRAPAARGGDPKPVGDAVRIPT